MGYYIFITNVLNELSLDPVWFMYKYRALVNMVTNAV